MCVCLRVSACFGLAVIQTTKPMNNFPRSDYVCMRSFSIFILASFEGSKLFYHPRIFQMHDNDDKTQ